MLWEKPVSQIGSFLGIESSSCGAARRFFYFVLGSTGIELIFTTI